MNVSILIANTGRSFSRPPVLLHRICDLIYIRNIIYLILLLSNEGSKRHSNYPGIQGVGFAKVLPAAWCLVSATEWLLPQLQQSIAVNQVYGAKRGIRITLQSETEDQ